MHRPIGRYRRSKRRKSLTHDTSSVVRLFSVVNVALFVQKIRVAVGRLSNLVGLVLVGLVV